MEMEMEFYVNTDMHVYVYVCVRDDSRDLEAEACFRSSFLSWYIKKLSASFRFFFLGMRVFYLKPLLWRDFLLHYSLLFDRVSRVSLSHPLHIKTR